MKVFISWSGDKGRAFAEVLHAWLPSVLQALKPFFSPDDIAKGARWSTEVGTELEASQAGIVIVTSESLSAPWIMFEAGALSKNVGRAKVVPILVDVEIAEVPGPLMQFQCAAFNTVDIKRLIRMLNSELKDASLTDDILESVFEMWWPKLEEQVSLLLQREKNKEPSKTRTDRDLLEEILVLSRSIAQYQSQESRLPTEFGLTTDKAGSLTLASVKKRLIDGGNLVGANLMQVNLSHLDLSGAALQGSNLVRANLTRANLVNANLDGANLEGAVLDEANLRGAVISRVNLWRASMWDIKNLADVKTMDNANLFQVALSEEDRKTVSEHRTLNISNYPELFAHYRAQGMTKAELRDLFLWTSHSYPGAGP